MYFNGCGVDKNRTSAARWTKLAADQGQPQALVRLGWMFSEGDGVTQNDFVAAKLFQRAAEQGCGPMCSA